MTDVTLQANVERELRWEPSIRGHLIGVSARNGVVELDGHVPSYYEKWGAERAAMRVAGVRSIASEIKVDLPDEGTLTDEDIARTATEHLTTNLLVPETVNVKVTEGLVTLTGSVNWQYQSDEAERVVRPLKGVKVVTLRGQVRSWAEREQAEDAAWSSLGVSEIKNDITIA
jgi:osmotically-inducible protein OsmY